jgi:hypothetical protein
MLRPMPFWVIVKTVPSRDRLALASVTLAGFETFAPKTRVQTGAKWKTVPFHDVLFRRVEERWRAIERALGVASVVKFGLTPAKVLDEEIAKLIARSCDPDGIVRLAARSPERAMRPGLALGSKVLIADELSACFDGLYAGMGAHDRELVLMNILWAQRPVERPLRPIAAH